MKLSINYLSFIFRSEQGISSHWKLLENRMVASVLFTDTVCDKQCWLLVVMVVVVVVVILVCLLVWATAALLAANTDRHYGCKGGLAGLSSKPRLTERIP